MYPNVIYNSIAELIIVIHFVCILLGFGIYLNKDFIKIEVDIRNNSWSNTVMRTHRSLYPEMSVKCTTAPPEIWLLHLSHVFCVLYTNNNKRSIFLSI